MTYKVLSLKWRPQSFADVVGQDHVVKTLSNAIKKDRIAQAYLFTGPRGVGKTTTARILAMAFNVESAPTVEFDYKSPKSIEIAEGRSIDVLEIDGASNRGIDEIRTLREQIKFSPMDSSYKIIIIDEVHMLTNQAFNALLRTLEEPPQHGKFIFATTDVHKVPATIISRCQRFDFNNISTTVISNRLQFIMESEKISFEPDSINIIAKKACGSMRDGLSMLDQAIAFCGDEFSSNNVKEALGIIDLDLYFKYTDAIRDQDYDLMVNSLNQFIQTGIPATEILTGIHEHIRNIIYAGIDAERLLNDFNNETKQNYTQNSGRWNNRDLIYINQFLMDTATNIRNSENPFILLEMMSLKLVELDKSVKIDELLSKLSLGLDERDLIPVNNDKSRKLEQSQSSIASNSTNVTLGENENKSLQENKSVENKITDKVISNDITPSIDSIQENWPLILKKIQSERPSIGAILEDFNPENFKENTIVFNSNTVQDYNEKMIQDGIKMVNEEFNLIFKQSVEIHFLKNKQKKNNKQNNSNQINKKNDDEVFNKVVDLFDGEIIR